MASRPQRKLSGSGTAPATGKGSGPSYALLGGIAVVVVVATVILTTQVLKPVEPTAAPSSAPADDPFASVPRAGADMGGDDVGTFTEKVGEEPFTLAFPKSFAFPKFATVPDGKCVKFLGREKSAVVWVIGAAPNAVTTRDLLKEASLDAADRGPAAPVTQRLGSVAATGEKLALKTDPELEAIVLRAPLGDREVVALGVAPRANAKLRSIVDAMLGSLRAAKLQGMRAVGGLTYLPRS